MRIGLVPPHTSCIGPRKVTSASESPQLPTNTKVSTSRSPGLFCPHQVVMAVKDSCSRQQDLSDFGLVLLAARRAGMQAMRLEHPTDLLSHQGASCMRSSVFRAARPLKSGGRHSCKKYADLKTRATSEQPSAKSCTFTKRQGMALLGGIMLSSAGRYYESSILRNLADRAYISML